MFVYITFRQDISAVISGFEATWAYFGGITKLVIIDNLKPAIKKPDRVSPIINKSFLEYAQARGFTPDPANVGHPRGKPFAKNLFSPIENSPIFQLKIPTLVK
ncbi:MAG: hypothetical protein ACYDIA_09080 [Candidatus Humimicrobiaceae bacterium]